jgi:hypothetical protein
LSIERQRVGEWTEDALGLAERYRSGYATCTGYTHAIYSSSLVTRLNVRPESRCSHNRGDRSHACRLRPGAQSHKSFAWEQTPFMVTTGTAAIVAAAIVSLVAHFLVGVAKSLVTLRSWWSSGLEMTLAGVIVGGATYLVGLVLPT